MISGFWKLSKIIVGRECLVTNGKSRESAWHWWPCFGRWYLCKGQPVGYRLESDNATRRPFRGKKVLKIKFLREHDEGDWIVEDKFSRSDQKGGRGKVLLNTLETPRSHVYHPSRRCQECLCRIWSPRALEHHALHKQESSSAST